MMDLRVYGIPAPGTVHANIAPARLAEMALERREGVLASNGALTVATGKYTGRAAKDKFVVRRPTTADQVWWGPNQPMEPPTFDHLIQKARHHYHGRELFVHDLWACADPHHRVAVRLLTETAWHTLFTDRLLVRPTAEERARFEPEVVIFHAPSLTLDPGRDQVKSEVAIALDLDQGRVLIAGTHYAGEIKKSVFTYLNYWMPTRGVFPMHCSANVGPKGDTALLFGLSGTGKTTLSADPVRRLIGDDEHGWSSTGVFNFEGGCYAKCIKLSQAGEPQIWDAIRFGSVLENVVLDPVTRVPNYDDASLTENTRAAYPLDFIPRVAASGGHPSHVLFLTSDAFGVLPPLAKLTLPQAQYHFLSGYTAKVAGTEAGVKEPAATFSSCFAAPFLPRPPARYAELLVDRLGRHNSQVWLVNTGWTGGPFGVGRRIPLAITRRLVRAILDDELNDVPMRADPLFGVVVPQECPDVSPELLQPRNTWARPEEYEQKARHLAQLFRDNFTRFAADVPAEVREAGP
jgi:phosphoenolpyruvate carboxykinase (ATP)